MIETIFSIDGEEETGTEGGNTEEGGEGTPSTDAPAENLLQDDEEGEEKSEEKSSDTE